MNLGSDPRALPGPSMQAFRPLTLRRLIRPFLEQPKFLLLAFFGPLIVVYLLTSFLPNSYQSTANILVEQRRVELGEIADVVTPRAIDSAFMSSQIEILLSAPVLERAATELGWIPTDGTATPEQSYQMIQGLARSVDVSRRLNSFVIDITAAGRTASDAANSANALADAYLAFQVDSQIDATEQAVDWMQSEIQALRERINQLNRRIAALRRSVLSEQSSDLTTLDDQVELLARRITEARVAASEAETRLIELSNIKDTDGVLAVAEFLVGDEIARQLRARATLSEELAAQSVDRGASHPSVVELNTRLLAIDQAIVSQVDLAIGSAQSETNIGRERVAALEAAVVELQNRSIEFSPTQLSIDELLQELEANQDLYQALIERQSEIASQRLAISSDARILARALAPLDPSGPRKALLSMLAAILGLMAGAAYLLAREILSNRYDSAQDIEEETGLRVILTGQPQTLTSDAATGPLQLAPPVLRPDNVDLVLFQGHDDRKDCMVVALAPLHSKSVSDQVSRQMLSVAKHRGRKAVIFDVGLAERSDSDAAHIFDDLNSDEVYHVAVNTVLNTAMYEATASSLKEMRRSLGLVIINLPALADSSLTPAWAGFADTTYIISEEPRPERSAINSFLSQIRSYGGRVGGVFMASD